MNFKKALVTGGAGFIGSNLVKQLVLMGVEVVVLDNFSSGYKDNLLKLPIKIIEGDIRNRNTVNKAIKGIEVVFHLAASVGNKRSIDFPFIDAETNVIGTLNLLEASRKSNVKKLIVSSSAGIFGELKTIPISEDHPLEPDTPYGCTKLCEEKLSLSYSKLYPIDVICLRYFNVYGPNQRYDRYGNVIPIFVFKMIKNEPIVIYGDGEQTRDFVCVRDVVVANIKAAQSIGVSGAFNIASGTQISINNLVKLITNCIQTDSKIIFETDRPGDVKHSLADISKARKLLGYNPSTSIQSGIYEYLKWAKNLQN